MKTKEVYICLLILLIIGVAYYCHNYFIQHPTRTKIYTNGKSQMEFDRLQMKRMRGKGMMNKNVQNNFQQAHRQEILKEDQKYGNIKDNNQWNRKNQDVRPQVAMPSFSNANGKVKGDKVNINEKSSDFDDLEGSAADMQKKPARFDGKISSTLKEKAKALADTITANKSKKPGLYGNMKDENASNNMKNGTKTSTVDQAQAGNTKGTSKKACSNLQSSQKFDCLSEIGGTEQLCLQRGCCWDENPARSKAMLPKEKSKQAPVDVPYCFYPPDFPGYSITGTKETEVGFQYYLMKNTMAYYPGDVKYLLMDVIFERENILHVKITDARNKRYEVPLDVPQAKKKASNRLYDVSVPSQGLPFSLTVTRVSTNTTVLSTKNMAPLMFTDQFLQLSSSLPSKYIYGIGERRGDVMTDTNWTRHTIWTRDQGPREETNLYGAHPFYQVMEGDGYSNGFFLLNSNAMDVVLQPLPAITWKTIGGILDFYIFMGPTPLDVTNQLTSIVGRPFMPPYWSLGFHICRWGYKNVTETLEVVQQMRKAGIPQDVQWNDIDYMENKKDFTTDEKNFGNQAEMVQKLHNFGMKYIVIVDPGIPVNVTRGKYKPLDLGLQLDIFLKNDSNQNLIGKVWPGQTVFPDFTNPKTQVYWTTLVSEFIDKVPVDGLWIDMNEISNFGNGSVDGCPKSKYDHPPYTPDVYEGSLYAKTICPSGKSYASRVYDVHNIYGLKETNATYQALKIKKNLRPFVISRSTFTGQGHFGGHWSGDNHGTFHDLYRSVSEILSMNLFGIPMVGADICGFAGDTTYELCLRWHQLGAFYPFSRNHNDYENTPQEPFRFDAAFAKAVREVYLLRYSLLPYLYTLFYYSHTKGHTVARPLFQVFPSDKNTYKIETQFMWGSSLMIVPVLEKSQTSVNAYLPFRSMWYDFFTGQIFNGGQVIALKAPIDKINLLVTGGSIIPMQVPAQTTYESRKNDFILLGAYDSQQTGYGVLYWDDGDSLDTYARNTYNEIEFYMNTTTMISKVISTGYHARMALSTITLYGVSGKPTSVTLNGQPQQFTFNEQLQVLNISTVNPKINLLREFVVQLIGVPIALKGTALKASMTESQQRGQGQQVQLQQGQGQQGQVQQGQWQKGQGQQGQWQQGQGQKGQDQQGQQGQVQQAQVQQGQQDQGQQGQWKNSQGKLGQLQQGEVQQGQWKEGQGQQGRWQQGQGQQGQVQKGQWKDGQGQQGQVQQGQQGQGQHGQWQQGNSQQGRGLQGQVQQGQGGHQDNRVYNFAQRNQGSGLASQQKQSGFQKSQLVGKERLTNQIPPISSSKIIGQPSLNQQNMVPAGNSKVSQPINRNLNRNLPLRNPFNSVNKAEASIKNDYNNKIQGARPDKILPPNQNSFDNKVPPSRLDNSINRKAYSNQDGMMSRLSKQDSYSKKLPEEIVDRNARKNMPIQSQDGLRQNLPLKNQDGSRQNLPVQNRDGLRQNLPVQNQDGFRQNIPLQNKAGSRQNLPLQNQGLRQNLPVQNKDGFRQNLPVQKQDGLRQNIPLQNKDGPKQNLPVQNQGLRQNSPVQNQDTSLSKSQDIYKARFEKKLPSLNSDGTVRKIQKQ